VGGGGWEGLRTPRQCSGRVGVAHATHAPPTLALTPPSLPTTPTQTRHGTLQAHQACHTHPTKGAHKHCVPLHLSESSFWYLEAKGSLTASADRLCEERGRRESRPSTPLTVPKTTAAKASLAKRGGGGGHNCSSGAPWEGGRPRLTAHTGRKVNRVIGAARLREGGSSRAPSPQWTGPPPRHPAAWWLAAPQSRGPAEPRRCPQACAHRRRCPCRWRDE
jgi:hypothetical protein